MAFPAGLGEVAPRQRTLVADVRALRRSAMQCSCVGRLRRSFPHSTRRGGKNSSRLQGRMDSPLEGLVSAARHMHADAIDERLQSWQTSTPIGIGVTHR